MELSCCHLFETTRIARKTEQTYRLNAMCSSMILTPISVHLEHQCIGIISLQKRKFFSWDWLYSIRKILFCQVCKFNTICTSLFIHLSIEKFVFHKQIDIKLLIKYTTTATQYNGSKICKTGNIWRWSRHITSLADIQDNHFEQYLFYYYFK